MNARCGLRTRPPSTGRRQNATVPSSPPNAAWPCGFTSSGPICGVGQRWSLRKSAGRRRFRRGRFPRGSSVPSQRVGRFGPRVGAGIDVGGTGDHEPVMRSTQRVGGRAEARVAGVDLLKPAQRRKFWPCSRNAIPVVNRAWWPGPERVRRAHRTAAASLVEHAELHARGAGHDRCAQHRIGPRRRCW